MSCSGPILVTGGAGFIGSSLAAQLSRLGYSVITCDNFNAYYTPQLKFDRVNAILKPLGIPCYTTELADPAQVSNLFARVRPSMVVNLAAQAGVRHSIIDPSSYIQSNLVAFGNIIEASRRHDVDHFVYASSSSVYGNHTHGSLAEDACTNKPVSLYAATKKANELIAHAYSSVHTMATTGVRFFSIYGPWGRPDMAYFSFTEKMLRGEAIPVFGNGQLQRDFTYIDDAVEALVRLLARPPGKASDGIPYQIYNIGNEQPTRVLDFIATLERVLERKADLHFLPEQAGDVRATFADSGKLRAAAGELPGTSLELGLTRFARWYQDWMGSCRPPVRPPGVAQPMFR